MTAILISGSAKVIDCIEVQFWRPTVQWKSHKKFLSVPKIEGASEAPLGNVTIKRSDWIVHRKAEHRVDLQFDNDILLSQTFAELTNNIISTGLLTCDYRPTKGWKHLSSKETRCSTAAQCSLRMPNDRMLCECAETTQILSKKAIMSTALCKNNADNRYRYHVKNKSRYRNRYSP